MRVWHCVESLPTRDWKVALAAVEGVHTSRRESTSPRTLGPGGPPVLGRLDRGVQTYGESTHPPTPFPPVTRAYRKKRYIAKRRLERAS